MSGKIQQKLIVAAAQEENRSGRLSFHSPPLHLNFYHMHELPAQKLLRLSLLLLIQYNKMALGERGY